MKYLDFFERQIAYFGEVSKSSRDKKTVEFQSRINNSRILLLGLGGIGSNLAIGLAQSGINEIIVCDFDIVEPSNLNRTLGYAFQDIGDKKGFVIKRYLEKKYPWCNVFVIDREIITNSDVEFIVKVAGKVDILINCIDTPVFVKNIISDNCIANKIPFIKGGYYKNFGGVGPFFIPKNSGCQRCFDKNLFLENKPQSEGGRSVSNPWLTQMIASLILSEVIGFISRAYEPQLLHHYLQYDCLSFKMEKIKIPVKEYCLHCEYIPKPYS